MVYSDDTECHGRDVPAALGLFRGDVVQALEHGQAGACYHGVADEGVPFIDIAAAIGRHLDLPVAAAPPEQVTRRFSFLAPFIGVDNPTSSALTTERLGWKPAEISLPGDIEHGTYFERQT